MHTHIRTHTDTVSVLVTTYWLALHMNVFQKQTLVMLPSWLASWCVKLKELVSCIIIQNQLLIH